MPQQNIETRTEELDWGYNGVDERRKLGCTNMNPSLNINNSIETLIVIQMFLLLFPTEITKTIIEETSKILQEDHLPILTKGEFLRFIGIWLLLSTVGGFKRRDFWSTKEIKIEEGAPYRFHTFMSRTRFDEILRSLKFTSASPPSYVDSFWEIRDMISCFNSAMEKIFSPGYITCLDESMSIWFNKWTCPGWIFVPRKPHPFENEYHTIGCGICGIIFRIDMVEGKDMPEIIKQRRNIKKGKETIHLLLRLCKPMYGTGRIIILDSGFCVLKGIAVLRKVGVFSCALIKKRRYWPMHVQGEVINEYLKTKNVGETDCLNLKFDNIPCFIFKLKEPDYVMKLMATYSGLIEVQKAKQSKRVWSENGDTKTAEFKYQEPFYNHFMYRHVIDDHNNNRHALPSIEDTGRTSRWACRVFSYILDTVEVNSYLAMKYFIWKDSGPEKQLLQFRKKLAMELINNCFISDSELYNLRKRSVSTSHSFMKAPKNARIWQGNQWECTATSPYQQYICNSPRCKKQVRTYCQCSPGVWRCRDCYDVHLIEAVDEEKEDH